MLLISATRFAAAIVAFAARWKGSKSVNKKYEASTTLWKAFLTFLATCLGGGALQFVQALQSVEMPSTIEQLKAMWPTYAIALALAILKAIDNWRKNSGVTTRTVAKLIIIFVAAGLVVVPLGCKTTVQPDGTRIIEADIQAMQIGFQMAESMYNIYMEQAERADAQDKAAIEAKAERQRQRMEFFLDSIEKLKTKTMDSQLTASPGYDSSDAMKPIHSDDIGNAALSDDDLYDYSLPADITYTVGYVWSDGTTHSYAEDWHKTVGIVRTPKQPNGERLDMPSMDIAFR